MNFPNSLKSVCSMFFLTILTSHWYSEAEAVNVMGKRFFRQTCRCNFVRGDPGERFRPHLHSQCFDHHLQWVDIGHGLN